jgi:hypothetical protein
LLVFKRKFFYTENLGWLAACPLALVGFCIMTHKLADWASPVDLLLVFKRKFWFAAGKEKHFWMRRLSVALQKGNAMTFDAYCEWRNTRDLRVHGQAGFIAKRKQQRRTRHSCLGLLCRVSIIWSVCAREASEDRLPC